MQGLEVPDMFLGWIRGRGKIDFRGTTCSLMLGLKGSGKSMLLENFAMRSKKVIDLFGSRDNEGLAWCRILGNDQILFVTGDSVDVKSKWDSMKMRELTLRDLELYDVILSVSAFYSDIEEEFHGLNEMIHRKLYRRTHWNDIWFLAIREASNYLYARLQISRNQFIAKSDFMYLLRESRHLGLSIGVDTIRWTSLDKEVRDEADYTILKRMGIHGLPHDLKFLYSYIEPPEFMNPKVWKFVLVCGRGPIAIGKFKDHAWHKKEGEDIVKELGLDFEYGEIPDYGSKSRNWLSDFEHGDIITKRSEGTAMHKIAEALHRSPNTIMRHIHDHNKDVNSPRGYCLKCRKIKHRLSGVEV